LKNKGIPEDLQSDFFELTKKLRDTITKMPMKYIGRSISNEFYSIFNYENQTIRRSSTIDTETLIKNFGTFSIPFEYYEAFKILGSFINGQDSILFKWAEFSVNASGNNFLFTLPSPLNNSGNFGTSSSADILGTPRTGPDIGAYEVN
jgi:hypothetical protein